MKRITKLSAVSFKGRAFSHELSAVNLITGQNWAGKSSRVEAMTLALAGYLPGIEKKAASIYDRLASGNPMSVRVEFEDGKLLNREYRRAAVKTTTEVKHIGLSAEYAVDAVMVDPLEFLGLSAKERVKFLCQRIKLEDGLVSPERLSLSIASECNSVMTTELDNLIAVVSDEMEDDFRNFLAAGVGEGEWLERQAETFGARKREAESAVRAGATTLSSLATASEPLKRLNPASVDKRLAEARLASTEVVRKLGQLQAEANQLKSKSAIPASFDLSIAQAKASVAGLESEITQVRLDMARAKRELVNVKSIACCPFCKSSAPGWSGALMDTYDQQVMALATLGDSVSKQLASARAAAFESLEKRLAAAEEAQEESNTELVAKNAEIAAQLIIRDTADNELRLASEDLILSRQQEADEKRNQSIAAQARMNMAKVEFYKRAVTEADKLLKLLVSRAVNPFCDKLNELCDGILPAPIGYLEGEFGMMKNDFITWRSFSGTERMLFCCSMTLAMASGSELKLAVLDEMGRLDAKNKLKLLERVCQLISCDVLHQAILIDVDVSGYDLVFGCGVAKVKHIAL